MEQKIIQLGKLEIRGFAALAPMAGVADYGLRTLCMQNGAAFCVGELTSSKGVSLGDAKSQRYLDVSPVERPMGTQLFGYEPQVMADAAKVALQNNPDFIDINMGCPAPKVTSSGAGSALLRNPKLAGEIVHSVKQVSTVPVTVKIRIGWDENSINAIEIAKICEDNGADLITVHGRTKAQGYRPSVNTDIIYKVKRSVSIPVIANGDVVDAKSAARLYEQTDCDMIMVGRAACGAPWIFRQINAFLEHGQTIPDAGVNERMMYLLNQAQLCIQKQGEKMAMLQMRKHAAWYLKGLRGAAGMRSECGKISTFEDLKNLVAHVLETNNFLNEVNTNG